MSLLNLLTVRVNFARLARRERGLASAPHGEPTRFTLPFINEQITSGLFPIVLSSDP